MGISIQKVSDHDGSNNAAKEWDGAPDSESDPYYGEEGQMYDDDSQEEPACFLEEGPPPTIIEVNSAEYTE